MTPRVDYTWEYASAASGGANFDRLLTMTYPQRPGQVSGNRRRIDFTYGTSTSAIEYFTNTITKMAVSSTATGTATEVAAYKRTGTGRRVETVLGQYASVQRYFDPAHLDAGYTGAFDGANINPERGLDQFGRPRALDYRNTNSGAAVQYAAVYKYSSSGERVAARVTQATLNGTTHDNDRSWAYRYDYLNRLVGSNRLHGGMAESVLRACTGGTRHSVNVPDIPGFKGGMRHIDSLVSRGAKKVAQEAKVGLTRLNGRVRRQVEKDIAMLRHKPPLVDHVEWHFFTSLKTGKRGPDPALLNYLRAHGIRVAVW